MLDSIMKNAHIFFQAELIHEVSDEKLLRIIKVVFYNTTILGRCVFEGHQLWVFDLSKLSEFRGHCGEGCYIVPTKLYFSEASRQSKMIAIEVMVELNRSYMIYPDDAYWKFAKFFVCNGIMVYGVPIVHFDTHLGYQPIFGNITQLKKKKNALSYTVWQLLHMHTEHYLESEYSHYIEKQAFGDYSLLPNPMAIEINKILQTSQGFQHYLNFTYLKKHTSKLRTVVGDDKCANLFSIMCDYQGAIRQFVAQVLTHVCKSHGISNREVQSNGTLAKFISDCAGSISDFPRVVSSKDELVELLTMIIMRVVYHSVQHLVVFSHFDVSNEFCFRLRKPASVSKMQSKKDSSELSLSDFVWRVDQFQFRNFIDLDGKSIKINDIADVNYNFDDARLVTLNRNFNGKLHALKAKYSRIFGISFEVQASIHV